MCLFIVLFFDVAACQVPMQPLDKFLDASAPRNQKNLKEGPLKHVRTALQQVVDRGDNPCEVHYVVDIGGRPELSKKHPLV